jgi:hypothetical protein
MFSISKPKLVSIGLLLAILVISLMFSSYSEGLDAIATVNKDAVKEQAKAKDGAKDKDAVKDASAGSSIKPMDSINLGKTLSVADITGTLKNNPGVQKMIEKPSSA